MKFSAISDVHIKNSNDSAEVLLLSFLKNPDVRSSDVILLLGDIFDLMIGPHSQYFNRYRKYFEEIKSLLLLGKKICYVEGNHDFHLKNLYKNFFKVHPDLDQNLFLISSSFEFLDHGKKIYFCHGDDIELNNFSYKVFKALVNSPPLRYVANYLMPYFLITAVGEYSSQKSRNKNIKRYSEESDFEIVRENFRNSAEVFFAKSLVDVIVCGHSHAKDFYVSPKHGFTYVNNGYAQHSKTYISIVDGEISFKDLT